MIPCEKNDDIQEIKGDVKDIKRMLNDHLIDQAIIKHKVQYHSKLWNGTIIGALGVIGYLAQKVFENVFRHP